MTQCSRLMAKHISQTSSRRAERLSRLSNRNSLNPACSIAGSMFPLLMGIPTDGGTRSAELKGSQQSTFFMRHQGREDIAHIHAPAGHKNLAS
jgi:hypothetical protein